MLNWNCPHRWVLVWRVWTCHGRSPFYCYSCSMARSENGVEYFHGADFGDVGWFECIECRDGSVQRRDCFREVVLTLVFDCLRCRRRFIRHRLISRYHLHTHNRQQQSFISILLHLRPQMQPLTGPMGHVPSNFRKLGDQVYLIPSNFCDYHFCHWSISVT